MSQPAVFVFAMHGCGACEEYLPRFKQLAGPYRSVMPIGIYDVAKDRKAAQLSDKLGVKATPTTIVMKGGRLRQFVGALGNAAINQLLREATRG